MIDLHLQMWRRMIVARRIEEVLGRLHKAGKTRGPIHWCDGQEAVGIGAAAALRDSDYVTSTHRGHAHYIGKGLQPYPILAEILGRATGYCGGRAGHMLIADARLGLIGGNAIVGAGIPAAAGIALSMQIRNLPRVAMCFFGDGAAQTGICHESMNIAALWKLPMVFVLEHNQYGLTVRHSARSSVPDLSVRAAGYAMPSVRVDGNDVCAMHQAALEAVERARSGGGPTLIEAKTCRLEGFSTSETGGYQDPAEIAHWRERDPIRVSRAQLEAEVGRERLDAIEQEASAEVEAAAARALADPMPSFEPDVASAAWVEAYQ